MTDFFQSRRNAIVMGLGAAALTGFLTAHLDLEDLAQNIVQLGGLALGVVGLTIGFHRRHAWSDFGLGLIPTALMAAAYCATFFVVTALDGHPQTGQWAVFWLGLEWELLTITCLIAYIVLWLAIKFFRPGTSNSTAGRQA